MTLDQAASEVETAFASEVDVDENNVRAQLLDTSQPVRHRRSNTSDLQSPSFKEYTRRIEKRFVVIDDQDT